MAIQHDEGYLGKDWLKLGACCWCRIGLDDENMAFVMCMTKDNAQEVDRALDQVFDGLFGETDPRQISEKEIAGEIEHIDTLPRLEKKRWFLMLETLFFVCQVWWDVDAWADDAGKRPPRQPSLKNIEPAQEKDSPLEVMPVDFTARLLWATKAIYSRAASGNWDALAGMPEQTKEVDMPPKLRQRLDDIMGEAGGGNTDID